MALSDRIAPLCDLLLGAAYADKQFKYRERQAVREMLADVLGATITPALEAQIEAFRPEGFELAATAAAFAGDPEDERRRLLTLVSAVTDADDEIDFAEDDYLRALGKALALPDAVIAGLTIQIERESLRADFETVRRGPPPPPGAKS